ncbi:MAG: HD domain-containing protein [Candidatus Paceibacterota bacterium]
MIHTPNIERAIHKASLLHRKQVRKGADELPYITHLFSVFVILAKYTHDEDVLIGGLLHDTLEDTEYQGSDLENDFGPIVRKIVEGVTEPKKKDGIVMPWEDRKRAYVAGLQSSSRKSLMVSAADKIHNFQSIIDMYADKADNFKKDFTSADRLRFYENVVAVINHGLGEKEPIVTELNIVFTRYRIFLEKVYT